MNIWSGILGAGLGLLGLDAASEDRKSQERSLALAQQQREQSLKFIQDQMNQSRGDLFQLFPQAQQSRNAGLLAGLNLYGQAFPQQLAAFQGGNMNAQQALLAGLPQMNNAILGRPVDMSMLQARQVPVDASVLSGLYNPQPINFATMGLK